MLERVVNTMDVAREFIENGGDEQLIYDGAGVNFIPELEKEDHPSLRMYVADKYQIVPF